MSSIPAETKVQCVYRGGCMRAEQCTDHCRANESREAIPSKTETFDRVLARVANRFMSASQIEDTRAFVTVREWEALVTEMARLRTVERSRSETGVVRVFTGWEPCVECGLSHFAHLKLKEVAHQWRPSQSETNEHNRPEVMNPPASAAQGAEARNLNTANVMGLGQVHRATEARPAEVAPLPEFGDPCPACASGKIGQSGYNFRCANCGWLGPSVPWSPPKTGAER